MCLNVFHFAIQVTGCWFFFFCTAASFSSLNLQNYKLLLHTFASLMKWIFPFCSCRAKWVIRAFAKHDLPALRTRTHTRVFFIIFSKASDLKIRFLVPMKNWHFGLLVLFSSTSREIEWKAVFFWRKTRARILEISEKKKDRQVINWHIISMNTSVSSLWQLSPSIKLTSSCRVHFTAKRKHERKSRDFKILFRYISRSGMKGFRIDVDVNGCAGWRGWLALTWHKIEKHYLDLLIPACVRRKEILGDFPWDSGVDSSVGVDHEVIGVNKF